MSLSSVIIFLSQNLLNNPNLNEWKSNLEYVNTAEEHYNVLHTPHPLFDVSIEKESEMDISSEIIITLVDKFDKLDRFAQGFVTAKDPSIPPKGGKKWRGKSSKKDSANSGSNGTAPTDGLKKPSGKCFRCGKIGHWKKNCLKPKDQRMPLALVTETCLSSVSAHSWVVDTGATDHVCYTLNGFKPTRELREGDIWISMGNGAKVGAVAVGDLSLCFDNSVLVLRDVLYVPDFRRNLVSVSKLYCDGYSVVFDNGVSIVKNNVVICRGAINDSLYTINCLNKAFNSIASTSSKPKKRKTSSQEDQTYLWHLRLGHISLNRIQRLVADGTLESFQTVQTRACESRIEGKMTTRPFKAKGYSVTARPTNHDND